MPVAKIRWWGQQRSSKLGVEDLLLSSSPRSTRSRHNARSSQLFGANDPAALAYQMKEDSEPSFLKQQNLHHNSNNNNNGRRSRHSSHVRASSTSSTISTVAVNSNNQKQPLQLKKGVAFGMVEIRVYECVIGDHPCCQHGCPLSLGWEYEQPVAPQQSVDEFERQKRGSNSSLRTTWEQRHARLLELTKTCPAELRTASRLHYRRRDPRIQRSEHERFFASNVPE